VAFAEYSILRDSFYDLCDIVAKYCPFRIFCSDQFHRSPLPQARLLRQRLAYS
jgi:hypothetical protein